MHKLSCPLCLEPHFEDVHALRTSLIAAATSDLQCPICQENFKGLDKLTIHLFVHIATSSALGVAEKDAKSEQPMQCDQQQQVDVVGIEEEISNAQIELANEQRTIRCDICNFTFSDANILDMHQKLLHQTLEDKQTGLYSYHCHLCSKKFKMKGSLMVHLRVAHYGFAGKSDREVIPKVKKPEEAKGGEEPSKKWSCEVCNKLFTTKYFLKKHKRLHTGERPYFCAECNKHFTFQQSYRKHMLYHSSEKPHVCAECGRAFKELSTLHNHQRIHSGERPFACETCGKCFRQRVSYLVHKRIHTGAMPYKCPLCEKTFRYKVSQRSHKCPGKSSDDQNGSKISERNINIVFNADGQIIGQNYAFDGSNLITYATTKMADGEDAMKDTKPETTTLVATTSYGPIQENEGVGVQNIQNSMKQLHLQTINEESLKQLLYGTSIVDITNNK